MRPGLALLFGAPGFVVAGREEVPGREHKQVGGRRMAQGAGKTGEAACEVGVSSIFAFLPESMGI